MLIMQIVDLLVVWKVCAFLYIEIRKFTKQYIQPKTSVGKHVLFEYHYLLVFSLVL